MRKNQDKLYHVRLISYIALRARQELGLFGSFVHDQANDNSHVDILVTFLDSHQNFFS